MGKPILVEDALLDYLTSEEQERYKELRQIDEALSSLMAYTLYVSGSEVEAFDHTRLLCEIVQALVEHRLYKDGPGPPSVKNSDGFWVHPVTGERALARLQIDMPPRHGKSLVVSEHLPAWFLSNYPERNVAVVGYEAEFAASWGEKAQRLVSEHPELGLLLHKKKQARDNWGLQGHKGGMFTAGAGGPLTGKGFHLGIIDDPIKNAEEAMSETLRTKLKNWWSTTFATRLQPGGDAVIILMATRWHEDDLSGYVTELQPDLWYCLSLPALSFDTVDVDGVSIDPETGKRDPLGRIPGKALAPKLWNEAYFDEQKALVGALWFQAMYQGKPSLEEGNKFKVFPRYRYDNGKYYAKMSDGTISEYLERQCYRINTTDLAATLKTSADYSVFAVFDVTYDHKMFVRWVQRERIESSEHKAWYLKLYRQWKVKYGGIESKTYGLTLIQHLRREPGIVIKGLPAVGDKVSRAITATTAMADWKIFIPEDNHPNMPWVPDWIKEHKKFPNATHDDMVDTTSYGAIEFENIPPWIIQAIEETVADRHLREVLTAKERPQMHDQIGYW